jgi:hypothetical protein
MSLNLDGWTPQVMKDGQQETLLVFTDKDPVKGEVTLKMDAGKRLEHIGVKVEFIGQIEMFYGNMHEFIAMVRDLDAPGELTQTKTYPFDFENVDKQYDSYNGINVKLRYFLRVTITRQYSPNIVHETDLWVKNVNAAPVRHSSPPPPPFFLLHPPSSLLFPPLTSSSSIHLSPTLSIMRQLHDVFSEKNHQSFYAKSTKASTWTHH